MSGTAPALTSLTVDVLRPTQSVLRRLERGIEQGLIHPQAHHVRQVMQSAKQFADAVERALTSTQ